MKKEISASKYIKAEEWCKGVVKTGHDLLFSTDKFDTEITKASIDLGYPMEVKTVFCTLFKFENDALFFILTKLLARAGCLICSH